jgi:hypothetical protein
MALWQYSFWVLAAPVTSTQVLNSVVRDRDTAEQAAWKRVGYKPLNYFHDVTKVFSQGVSWTPELLVYGDLDASCVTLCVASDRVEEIEIRVDLRTDYEAPLTRLAALSCFQQVQLVATDGSVLPFDTGALVTHIAASNHYRCFNKLLGDES